MRLKKEHKELQKKLSAQKAVEAKINKLRAETKALNKSAENDKLNPELWNSEPYL